MLVLWTILAILSGCGGGDGGDNPSIEVKVAFSPETSDGIKRVHLTVTNTQDVIQYSQDLKLLDNEASGSISLQPGEYNFDVKAYDKDDYLRGQASKKINITQDSQTAPISIDVPITVPQPPPPIEVTLIPGGECQTVSVSNKETIYVYNDSKDETLTPYSPSGWMGDNIKRIIDNGEMIFKDNERNVVYDGTASAKITYSPSGSEKGRWAGIYWFPVDKVKDNWENVVFGVDLRGMSKLTWFAKGSKGGEKVKFFAGGVKNIPCLDSLPKISVDPEAVTLTTDWQQFEIDLSPFSKYMNFVVGGFGFSIEKDDNPNGATFYVDEVKFVK